MSVKKIIEEDWTDYDNKKIIDNRDRKDFACSETWEVTYLVNKIRKHYPNLSVEAITTAIRLCCTQLRSPYPRIEFVKCVAKKLSIPEV